MAEKRVNIAFGSNGGIQCCWKISPVIHCQSPDCTPVQVIDLHLAMRYQLPGENQLIEPNGSTALVVVDDGEQERVDSEVLDCQEAFQFLLECLHATEHSEGRTVRLIVPLKKGTVIRSDIMFLRLGDASWAEKVVPLAKPLQVYSGDAVLLDAASLPDLFRASAAGVLLRHEHRDAPRFDRRCVSGEVEADFVDKMALSWILPEPVRRKRLVLVGTSVQDPSGGGWTQFAHRAAHALGIDLVVIDQPGRWLERSEFSDWYDDILPAGDWWSLPPGDDMADHLVGMVRSYGKKVDGIITFFDSFQATVSRAAQQLGLASQPSEAYAIATDKHRLGVFEGRQSFRASTAAEALEVAEREELPYPLILKPCLGLNSEGVVRVDDAAAIPAAVEAAQKTFCREFAMERYCEGPEVDVNVVLVDGEVLFCEISDDFPKAADTNNVGAYTSQKTFQETNMVFPSALPPRELEELKDAVSRTILRLGFTSGVMHVEARMDGSSAAYRAVDGIVDLISSTDKDKAPPPPSNKTPTPWLLDVNPRPPGLIASQIVHSVYGVDYWGISLLLAVDDKERARALARPFRAGAQYTGILQFVIADFDSDACEGVFDSDDVCEELFGRRPDLAGNVGRYGCLLKRGQKIPHPDTGANKFLAYFNVFSTKSRTEALEIATQVREGVQYSFR